MTVMMMMMRRLATTATRCHAACRVGASKVAGARGLGRAAQTWRALSKQAWQRRSESWTRSAVATTAAMTTAQHTLQLRLLGVTGLAVASVAGATAALWALGDTFGPEAECRRNDAATLCKAAQFNDIRALDYLLVQEGVDVNARHTLGWTPLHVAAVNGNVDACRLLLEHGAQIDAEDAYTPQLTAGNVIAMRQRDFSRRLNPTMPTVGMTALHYAALIDNEELVELFVQHGADPNTKDQTECKPIDYTESERIKRRLRAYMREHAELKAEREKEEAERREEEAKRKRREFPLEQRLHQYLVGQEGPIMAVAAAVRRRENGWHDEDHPLVFLFLGSSGVGKTELAKRLAQYIHHDEKTTSNRSKGFIRLDMTEYQEKHEAAKLIGAPPGYVGHDEGGQLTKMLKSCPNAVVLLDEVEKAHPDVLTVMLQLFDEGRLTDGQGKTIDCKDAIFVMTSNLASDVIAEHAWELRQRAEELQESDENFSLSKQFKESIIRPILKSHFKRDEFLGRIDEILYFVPFSKSELKQLVLLELKKWQQRAKQRHSVDLTWDESVVQRVAHEYDIHYGARSLQHAVDQLVINRLAHAHEQDKIERGCSVRLFVKDAEVQLDIKRNNSSGGGGGAFGWLFGGSDKGESGGDKQMHREAEEKGDVGADKKHRSS